LRRLLILEYNINLLERYERNPALRGLIQLIPFGIGSGIDVALCTQLENIRNERIKTFFDELGNGSIVISTELLNSEDFLHCYFATVKAALNSRRREKIGMFARLLKSSACDDRFSNTDEYEEYLGILDELSYRELTILFKLYRFEFEHPMKENENDLQRANYFWSEFTREIVEQIGVPSEEIPAVLTRLNRTGCYETFVGAYWDYEGGQGKTTPTFERLKELIENNVG
jgi:hypothetical protein